MYLPVTVKESTLDRIRRFNIYGAISFNTYKINLGILWDGPLNGYYPMPKGSAELLRSRWDTDTTLFRGLFMPVSFNCTAQSTVEKRVFFSDVLRRINR